MRSFSVSNIPLFRDGDFAELLGVILGDGSIHRYARTEGVCIVCNANNPREAAHYAAITQRVFGKKPSVIKRKDSEVLDIRLYQKNISSRLGIAPGNRTGRTYAVPRWILRNRDFMVRYLRGLYEAEGSYSVHLPTYTHKFHFSNTNPSLRRIVFRLMKRLGFHPHMTGNSVQISRKKEVEGAMKLLRFRKYDKGQK